jgi:hypothetical protein
MIADEMAKGIELGAHRPHQSAITDGTEDHYLVWPNDDIFEG